MRRLGRRIANVFTAFSLLLCIATIVVSSRGFSIGGLSEGEIDRIPAGTQVESPLEFRIDQPDISWSRHRYYAGTWEVTGFTSWSMAIPIWMVILALAAAPVTWVAFRAPPFIRRHSLTARRLRRGLCIRCGYDLTGNVSGVCPECGAALPTHPNSRRLA